MRRPFRPLATVVVGASIMAMVLPVLAILGGRAVGFDLASPLGLAVGAALAVTAAVTIAESLTAVAAVGRRSTTPPVPMPTATAIIAAYLPNETTVVLPAVRAFLALADPIDLQVVLAYNTPTWLAIEDELAALAAAEPRLVVLRVEGSESKAANLNAALEVATGEFCGIFDADHLPEPGGFRRAWATLSGGADVVQGHCAVRDGERSRFAQTVAVEMAAMYGLGHPGRLRLFGMGVFGGSNGYWRTDVLRRVRFRDDALTEDIDASIRLAADGGRIQFDPGIRSWELSPPDLGAFVRQRQRWAHGWLQVGLRHLGLVLRSGSVSWRMRLAAVWMFAWCPVMPWLNIVAIALLAERWLLAGALPTDEPLFIGLAILTLAAGSLRALAAWHVAPAALHDRPRWFVAGLVTLPLLGLIRDHAARQAHVAELLGERIWLVTPRPSDLVGLEGRSPTGPISQVPLILTR